MATRKSALWVPERAEIIFIQYSPQVGVEINARPHPWGTGHTKLLSAALKRFDNVFKICDH
jgi:hypothetical protein